MAEPEKRIVKVTPVTITTIKPEPVEIPVTITTIKGETIEIKPDLVIEKPETVEIKVRVEEVPRDR